MKILLIRPAPHNDTLGLQHIMLCEPLELEYMAACLNSKNHEIIIKDMILEKQSFESMLLELNPELVGFTGYITHVNIIKNMSKKAKSISKKIITVVGGVHAEVVPSDFNCSDIDYIINENAFFSFPYLIENLSKGNVIKEKVINSNSVKEFIEFKDILNNIPFPNRKLTEKYRNNYYYAFHNPPGALIKTSFGCPFSCNFCFCREITKHKYYQRPINNVIEELKIIDEDEVYIVDDNFLCDKLRLEKFIKLIKKNNIKKSFLVYGRADFIAAFPDLIKELKKVGLSTVIIGYESFKEDDLNNYNKDSDLNSYFIATKILKSLDIDIYGTFILDMDWTFNDFNNFYKYLKKLDLRFINLQPLTPIPGTSIFEKFENKLIIPRENFEKWDLAHLTIKPENLSVRLFYLMILVTYLRLSFSPKNLWKNIEKYSFFTLMKISIGTRKIIFQYMKKIFLG